jgi:hypothetical protein
MAATAQNVVKVNIKCSLDDAFFSYTGIFDDRVMHSSKSDTLPY